MSDIVWITALVLALWYWWDTVRTQEIARNAGKRACQQAGVQILDDTVERKRQWLRRNSNGRMQVCRLYFFEFSSDGATRYQGRIVMFGQAVRDVDMDAYRIPE
jgi:Protein of unknown function (DUF3301)